MRDFLTVSPSSLSVFYRCSQAYKWQFIDEREPDVEGVATYTIFGTAFHRAMELHFKYGLGFDELKKVWRALFISFCIDAKGLVFPNPKELDLLLKKGIDQLDNVVKMKCRWEKYSVFEVEKYVRLPYKNKFLKNVFLSGRIDLLLKDSDSFVCLDWKTSKTKEKNIDENVQLTFYNYFIRELYKYQLDNIYGALVYPHDCDILFSQRSEEDFKKMLDSVDAMLERISKNVFNRDAKINMRLGDCFFCQYKKTCNSV